MNIQTVAENLKKTIAGKEHMLDSHKRYLRSAGTSGPENTAIYAIVQFLEVNIDELKRILQDVEQCTTYTPPSYDSDPYDGPMIKMFRDN